jgi:lysozyme family protein
MLQKALNLTNRKGVDYANIPEDGKIGQGTINAYKANKNKRILYNVINILQGAHYVALMEAKEDYERYIGWFDRVEIIKK